MSERSPGGASTGKRDRGQSVALALVVKKLHGVTEVIPDVLGDPLGQVDGVRLLSDTALSVPCLSALDDVVVRCREPCSISLSLDRGVELPVGVEVVVLEQGSQLEHSLS